jgi:hypothetical protein
MACENRNVILILDQCSAHDKDLNLKHVCPLYLPPNTISYPQPLDQGIIYCMKNIYQKHRMQVFLQAIDRNVPAADIRTWKILDGMCNVTMMWESSCI